MTNTTISQHTCPISKPLVASETAHKSVDHPQESSNRRCGQAASASPVFAVHPPREKDRPVGSHYACPFCFDRAEWWFTTSTAGSRRVGDEIGHGSFHNVSLYGGWSPWSQGTLLAGPPGGRGGSILFLCTWCCHRLGCQCIEGSERVSRCECVSRNIDTHDTKIKAQYGNIYYKSTPRTLWPASQPIRPHGWYLPPEVTRQGEALRLLHLVADLVLGDYGVWEERGVITNIFWGSPCEPRGS